MKKFTVTVGVKPDNPLEVDDEESLKSVLKPEFEDAVDTYQIIDVKCAICHGAGEYWAGKDSRGIAHYNDCPQCKPKKKVIPLQEPEEGSRNPAPGSR